MIEADGVHSGYEDEMIAHGYLNEDLAKLLGSEIKRQKGVPTEKIETIESGYDASKRVIELIAATQAEIAPRDIVDKWVELKGTSRKEKAAAMWEVFGTSTVSCMARGTRYLAAIWQAAWTQGEGDKLTKTGKRLDEETIMALYNDPAVIRSVALNKYPEDASADWSNLA